MLSPTVAEELIAALRGLVRRSRAFDATARDTDPDALPGWLAALLAHLETTGCHRLGELADKQGVTASTLSRQLTYAESLGYAERQADPDDRRAARLVLTDKGATALRNHRMRYVAIVREAVPDWTDDEARELIERLSRLGAAVDRLPTAHPS